MVRIRKAAIFILVLFVWSGIAIAFDQHDGMYSSKCPICHTKNLINGNQDSFELDINLALSYYCPTERQFDTLAPVSVPFEGRAPPVLFQN